MDAKRSQSTRKVATPHPSKTRMPPKTQSQASVTPSQVSEAARAGIGLGEKNPLDALSRTTTARTLAFERRSGLQDVDEEYLKRVTMPAPTLPRHEFAAGKRTPQQNIKNDTNLGRNLSGGAEEQQQQQGQQQQSQQQQQMNMTQEQMMAQAQAQNQAQMQQNAMPAQQTTGQPLQNDMQQQQQSAQQVTYMPAAGEPELCTTCPHCQTTIYLTRATETQQMPGMHGQPEGTGTIPVGK